MENNSREFRQAKRLLDMVKKMDLRSASELSNLSYETARTLLSKQGLLEEAQSIVESRDKALAEKGDTPTERPAARYIMETAESIAQKAYDIRLRDQVQPLIDLMSIAQISNEIGVPEKEISGIIKQFKLREKTKKRAVLKKNVEKKIKSKEKRRPKVESAVGVDKEVLRLILPFATQDVATKLNIDEKVVKTVLKAYDFKILDRRRANIKKCESDIKGTIKILMENSVEESCVKLGLPLCSLMKLLKAHDISIADPDGSIAKERKAKESKAIGYINSGLSVAQACKKADLSNAQVRTLLKKNGIEIKRTNSIEVPNEEELQRIKAELALSSVQVAAERLGYSTKRLRQILWQTGIKVKELRPKGSRINMKPPKKSKKSTQSTERLALANRTIKLLKTSSVADTAEKMGISTIEVQNIIYGRGLSLHSLRAPEGAFDPSSHIVVEV